MSATIAVTEDITTDQDQAQDQAVELLRRVVAHAAPWTSLVRWTAESFADRARAAHEHVDDQSSSPPLYFRRVVATVDVDGVIRAGFDLAGPMVQPEVTSVSRRSPLMPSKSHDDGTVRAVPVGTDGPTLFGDDWSLSSWSTTPGFVHPLRHSIQLVGRLGVPVAEPFVPVAWAAGVTLV